jgi:hypothetical protein
LLGGGIVGWEKEDEKAGGECASWCTNLTSVETGKGYAMSKRIYAKEAKGTYLSKNTHLHVVWSLIAPPSNGPRIPENANTDEIIPMYFPNLSGGITATATMETIE